MSRWLHELPVALIALVVVAGVALLVASIYLIAMRVASSDRREAMQALSPGLLPPLGIVFALIVGFLAAGVWGDSDKARDAVSSEASALRSVVLLSEELPPATAAQMRLLVRRQIDDAVHTEWPAMRDQSANLATVPTPLLDAQRLALSFSPRTPGEVDAQRELVSALVQALDARRQRIIVSQSHVNAVKWLGLLVLAAVMLIGIVCVHIANRRTALLAMSLFATAVAVVLIMLVAQDQPFTGHLGQTSSPLEQVLPQT
jgi:nitrate reductase gamma subunit